jgi:hypothetical protein
MHRWRCPSPFALAFTPALTLLGLACTHAAEHETCAPDPAAPAAVQVADEDPWLAAYLDGLAVAAYPVAARESTRLLVLDRSRDDASLTWDEAGRLLVTTWTRSKYFTAPEYQPGYAFDLYGETWFTAGDQVAAACREFEGDEPALVLRLEQLLGLPPAFGYDVFMQVWIEPTALFRPCADPSVTTAACTIRGPLRGDSAEQGGWDCAAPADPHSQWLCNAWVARYGQSEPTRRFPWTALGYAYDWSPDSPSAEGPSEFVAAAKTPVVFERLVATAALCGR